MNVWARLPPLLALATTLALPARALQDAAAEPPVVVPRLWDEKALEGWATPLAGLGRPPTHVSSEAFYAAPVDNLRSFPVYHPDYEPAGYREELMRRGPQPLIEPEKLKTKADWIEAGRIVFGSLETPQSRTDDPEVIAHFTSAETIDRWRDAAHDVIDRNGIILDYRWVVDRPGHLQLSLSSCAGCHTRLMPDGSTLPGAPCNFDLSDAPAVHTMLDRILPLPDMTAGQQVYAQFGVPWRTDDPHLRFRDMADADLFAVLGQPSGEPPGTMFARFNGSPLHKTRMADLRGIRDRRWLDATGSHRNRGPEDVARYGLLVEYVPDVQFGEHLMLTLPPSQLERLVRPPDEAMYAMALYLYSLDPAPSPHACDEQARRGQEVFASEGCVKCHVPPLYTNNKLVAVPGFDPPADGPLAEFVSNRRVNTDPGMALETRKGTGFYKVPSLRGLWYRGLYGHEGWFTSLEDWFDPARLRADHVPSGWQGPGVQALAVPGHDFGLDLQPQERADLIAFLKTL